MRPAPFGRYNRNPWELARYADAGLGGALAEQVFAAREAAARVLDPATVERARGSFGIDRGLLQTAKRLAREELKAAKEARKAAFGGGFRQLRLALAQPAPELALAA